MRTASAVRTGNTRNTPAAEALAARSAPSGLSALAGTGTPLAAGRSPQPGWLGGSRNASTPAVRKAPRSGWLGNTRGRPRTVIGSAVGDRTGTGAAAGIRRGAFRRRRPVASTVVGSAVTRGNWYTASPSTAWLRRSRNSRKRGMRRRRLLRMMGVAR